MKTYTAAQMDQLMERTIKTVELQETTWYLDLLKTGEYAVSEDERCIGVFMTEDQAMSLMRGRTLNRVAEILDEL